MYMSNFFKVKGEEDGVSLRWLTPALSQSHAADAAGDEYSLEYGRVRVTREEREDSAATSLVTVTTWAVVDPVALGDQGFYLCQVIWGYVFIVLCRSTWATVCTVPKTPNVLFNITLQRKLFFFQVTE